MNEGVGQEQGGCPVYFKMPPPLNWVELGCRDDGAIVWKKACPRRDSDHPFLAISPAQRGGAYGLGLESSRIGADPAGIWGMSFTPADLEGSCE